MILDKRCPLVKDYVGFNRVSLLPNSAPAGMSEPIQLASVFVTGKVEVELSWSWCKAGADQPMPVPITKAPMQATRAAQTCKNQHKYPFLDTIKSSTFKNVIQSSGLKNVLSLPEETFFQHAPLHWPLSQCHLRLVGRMKTGNSFCLVPLHCCCC